MSSAQSDAEWAVQDREHDEKRLAEMDAQLAAKDAEIAELRRHMVADKHQAARATEAQMLALTRLDRAREDFNTVRAERDEARECVKRLYSALASVETGVAWLAIDAADADIASAIELRLRAALAATPEHPR